MPSGIYKRSKLHIKKLSDVGKKFGGYNKGRKMTEEQRRKIRDAHIGKKLGTGTKIKISNKLKGIKRSKATRIKMSLSRRGEKSHLWRGGKTEENKKIRRSLEYRLWRDAVFIRDNYTCVFCGNRGGKLDPDHIKPFSLFPELRFAIDNGRTLCRECHKKTDTYGKNIKVNAIKE